MAAKFAARRLVAVAALAAAVVAGPAIAALSSSDTPAYDAQPGGKCLAWLGAKGTGTCIGRSNSNSGGITVGTPGIGLGNGGIYSGPMMPGSSVGGTIPIG